MSSVRRAFIFSIVSVVFGSLGTAQVIFTDDYIGGVATSSSWAGDSISNPVSEFNLTGGSVNVIAGATNSLNIKIYADNYFNNIINNSDALLGTSLGDLFISVGPLAWHPSGDTTKDYFESPDGYTRWDYGIRLGTYDNTDGADLNSEKNGDLYELDSTQATSQIKLSDDYTTGIYRSMQEVRIDDQATWAAGTIDTNAATWYIDPSNNDFLSITLNDFDTLLGVSADNFTLGFHWAMTCANDVIEFQVTNFGTSIVPEPKAIALLSMLGLAGLLMVRRRFTK